MCVHECAPICVYIMCANMCICILIFTNSKIAKFENNLYIYLTIIKYYLYFFYLRFCYHVGLLLRQYDTIRLYKTETIYI